MTWTRERIEWLREDAERLMEGSRLPSLTQVGIGLISAAREIERLQAELTEAQSQRDRLLGAVTNSSVPDAQSYDAASWQAWGRDVWSGGLRERCGAIADALDAIAKEGT